MESTEAPCYLWQGKFWCPLHAPSKLVAVNDTRSYRNDGARPKVVSKVRNCAGCGVEIHAEVRDRE